MGRDNGGRGVEDVTGNCWVEARNAAQYSTVHRTARTRILQSKMSGVSPLRNSGLDDSQRVQSRKPFLARTQCLVREG